MCTSGACVQLTPPSAPPSTPRARAAALSTSRSSARTKDGLGVTIPSQRRYVNYFETMVHRFEGRAPPPRPVKIMKVIVQSQIKTSTAPYVYFLVHEGPRWLRTKQGSQGGGRPRGRPAGGGDASSARSGEGGRGSAGLPNGSFPTLATF